MRERRKTCENILALIFFSVVVFMIWRWVYPPDPILVIETIEIVDSQDFGDIDWSSGVASVEANSSDYPPCILYDDTSEIINVNDWRIEHEGPSLSDEKDKGGK